MSAICGRGHPPRQQSDSQSIAAPILVSHQLKTNIWIWIGTEISPIPTVDFNRLSALSGVSVGTRSCVVMRCLPFVNCGGKCWCGCQDRHTGDRRKKFDCARNHGVPFA